MTTTDNDKEVQNWLTHDDASFHDFSLQQAGEIRQALLSWYRRHRRKLPWRGDPPPYDGSTAITKKKKASTKKESPEEKTSPVSAYGTWVSEVMLQQTRVEAVIPYWLKWMESFPTVHHLANATEEQVNSHWAGLGFYRRARLLHQGAKHVVTHHHGQLPKTVDELRSIPGIGPYTAAAIASIAYNLPVAVVDGNVCRVLCRLRGIANHIKAPALKDAKAWDLAQQIMDAYDTNNPDSAAAGELNQAMMELGATYCSPSGTGVDHQDPLRDYYLSTKIGAFFDRNPTLEDYLHDGVTTSACKLCAENGISIALDNLSNALLNEKTNGGPKGKRGNHNAATVDPQTTAKIAGHSVFPIPPPKLAKREEVHAIAVLSGVDPSNTSEEITSWLLVKRPEKGLLAGQWEFPSVCVWNSEDDRQAASSPKTSKKKTTNEVPVIPAPKRRKLLTAFVEDVLAESIRETDTFKPAWTRLNKGVTPLEHVFSHVRHTMWVEYVSHDLHLQPTRSWTTTNGKHVRWMTETQMKEMGVTSGVKKVLKAVQADREKQVKTSSFFQPKGRKRKKSSQ